jgi:ABC-type transport system substrate-binding protein
MKHALSAVIVILLLLLVLDRWRQPQQLHAVTQGLEQLAAATRMQTEELKALRQQIAERPLAPTGTTVVAPAPAANDGLPVLGRNFLLPYDRSWYQAKIQGGTLRLFNESPKGLNPLLENSATTAEIHGRCNDSLADRPATNPGAWMQALAPAVVISDDYTTYTFTLRPGVRWQRPTLATQPGFAWLDQDVELTSADFAFALRLITDPAVECSHLRNYYADFDRAETPDPRTLVLHWKKAVYTSLSASLGLSPLPRHIYGAERDGSPTPPERLAANFNQHWFDAERGVCGVGPYRLEEYTPDQVMRFARNPAYWGATWHFDRIEQNLAIRQPDPQLVAFKNGQVHSHGLAPLQYKSEVLDRKEPRFAAFSATDPKAGRAGELGWERVRRTAFSYLGWNMRRPPFDDVRVRQAMSHAFPKERIIRDVYLGLGQPVLSDVLADSPYCNRALTPYAFDLAKAKALLAEAGWTDSDGDGLLDKLVEGKRAPFSFVVSYYANSPEWDNTLMIFRNELRTIGVAMEPRPYEWKELIRIYEDRDFSATVGGWQMDWEVDFYQLWHSSQITETGGSNHCAFSDPEVDRLAIELRETFDEPKRIAISQRIQAIIHEAQPYTFFRSAEGIFTWQNRAPAGDIQTDRWLLGVSEGLDRLHPLKNRTPLFWHLRTAP